MMDSTTNIIFFLNTNVSTKFSPLLLEYLKDIKSSRADVDQHVKLIFVIVGTRKYQEIATSLIKKRLEHENLVFKYFKDSHYEYHGINTFYETACQLDSDYVIYSHCKSISHRSKKRCKASRVCSNLMLQKYKHNVKFMDDHPNIDKLGVGQSQYGSMWYNFFMCRSKFVRDTLSPPEVSKIKNDRYEYERWLGNNRQGPWHNGHSIMWKKTGFKCDARVMSRKMASYPQRKN